MQLHPNTDKIYLNREWGIKYDTTHTVKGKNMPVLIALSAIIQIVLIVHALKTGREHYWIFIILIFPFLGSGAYFFVEMLPEIRQSRISRQTSKKILTAIDPQRNLKERAHQLAMSNNTQNKIELARECNQHGIYDEAIKLYQDSLTGIYDNDPNIMLELAQSLFHNKDFQDCKTTLEQIIEHNPDFKSQDGHLLYARTLEALSDNDAALHEYQALSEYYSGYEARCRYALLLQKHGRVEQAKILFNEILQHAKNLSPDRRKLQRDWINIAKQHVW